MGALRSDHTRARASPFSFVAARQRAQVHFKMIRTSVAAPNGGLACRDKIGAQSKRDTSRAFYVNQAHPNLRRHNYTASGVSLAGFKASKTAPSNHTPLDNAAPNQRCPQLL